MSPLIKQPPLFVPVGGLQTDIDDKLLPQGKLLDLENAFQVRAGEVVKRFGTTSLGTGLIGGGSLPAAIGSGQHKGALCSLSAPGPNPLCTWSPTEGNWVAADGDRRGPIAVSLNKVRGSATAPDVAYGGGFYWVSYAQPSGGGAGLDMIDAASGHRVLSLSIAAAEAGSFRPFFVNGFGILVYKSGADELFLTVNSTTFAQATTTAAGGGVFNPDVRQLNSTTMQVIGFVSGAAAALDFAPATATATIWTPKTSSASSIAATAVAWIQDFGGSGKIALIAHANATGVTVQWDIPSTGATRQAVSSYTLDAAALNLQAMTGHTTASSATGEFVVVYDIPSGTDINRAIKISSRLSGSITTGPTLHRSVMLASKSWTSGGDFFVLGTFLSTTQGTRYVLRIPTVSVAQSVSAPLAQFAVRQGFVAITGISQVASPSAGKFTVAIDYKAILATGGYNPDAFAIQLATLTYLTTSQTTLGIPREAIGSLFVPGGNLGQFDGVTYAEAGFAYSPEQPALTPGAGGGLTASSTYWYLLVYSYMDAQGKLWRSQPSILKSVTTGVGQGTVTAACPTLRITGRTNIKIEVYRGAAGDDITFQKAGIVANDMTVDSVNFVDTSSDTALASGEFLYTDGGGLPSQTPPGFLAIAVFDNRLWGIPWDDPQSLWYTNEFTLGGGLIWNERLVVDVKDAHGDARNLAVVDSSLIVLKDDATYAIQGQGPNGFGQGGSYASAIVAKGVGCNNAQAALETKDGVIFRSTTSKPIFYLLDRGLSLVPLGGVQRYASLTIVAAAFVPSLQQARFYTSAGRTLVYDHAAQIWSTNIGQGAFTATAWNGVPVYMSSSDVAYAVEDLTGATYTERGAAITMSVTFPWLSLNNLHGYERFYRVQTIGEVAGAHSLGMSIYKDFDDGALLTSGTKAFASGLLDAELRYSAKLSAIKVKLSEGSTTAGPKISGLAIVWGGKAGLKKLPATSRPT